MVVLELCCNSDDDEIGGGAGCELEIGEDTLEDLLVSLESNLRESLGGGCSCLGIPWGWGWGCLIMPYNTSAISISISSWAATDAATTLADFAEDDDFGGLSFGPLGFWSRITTWYYKGNWIAKWEDGRKLLLISNNSLSSSEPERLTTTVTPEMATAPPRLFCSETSKPAGEIDLLQFLH